MSAAAPALDRETVALVHGLDTAEEISRPRSISNKDRPKLAQLAVHRQLQEAEAVFHALPVSGYQGFSLSALAVRTSGLAILDAIQTRKLPEPHSEPMREEKGNYGRKVVSGRKVVGVKLGNPTEVLRAPVQVQSFDEATVLDGIDHAARWLTLRDLQDRAEEIVYSVFDPYMERRASGRPFFADTEPRWSDDRILGPTYMEAEDDGPAEPMSAERVALYEGVPVGRVLRLREADITRDWMPTDDRGPVDHNVWEPSKEGVQAARKRERFVLSRSVEIPDAGGPVAVRPSLDGARDLGIRTMRHDAADGRTRQRLKTLAMWGDLFLKDAKLTPTGLMKDKAPGGSHPHDRDEDGCRERFNSLVFEHGLGPQQLKVRRGRGNRTDLRLIEVLGQLRRDGFDLRDIAIVTKVGKRTLERHIGGIKPDHKTPEDEPVEVSLEPYALRTRLDGGPWLLAWKGSNWADEQREIGREIAVLDDGGTPGRPVRPKLKARRKMAEMKFP